jgi:hypothetical protein
VFKTLLAKYPAVRASIAELHHTRSNPGLPLGSHPAAWTGPAPA